MKVTQQRPGEPQRAEGVHLELAPHALRIEIFEAVALEDAGVVDQAIERQVGTYQRSCPLGVLELSTELQLTAG